MFMFYYGKVFTLKFLLLVKLEVEYIKFYKVYMSPLHYVLFEAPPLETFTQGIYWYAYFLLSVYMYICGAYAIISLCIYENPVEREGAGNEEVNLTTIILRQIFAGWSRVPMLLLTYYTVVG